MNVNTSNKSSIEKFIFKNNQSRDNQIITEEFLKHGLVVADISRECFGMWTWVLLESGDLWVLDKSHGGGGIFTLHKRN